MAEGWCKTKLPPIDLMKHKQTNTYDNLSPVKRRKAIATDRFIEKCLANGYRLDIPTAGFIHLTTRPKVY